MTKNPKIDREVFDVKKDSIREIHELTYYFNEEMDYLMCGGWQVYGQGKFAKIIPQEESLTENDLQGNAVAKEEEAVKITLNGGTVIWKTKWDILQEPKTESSELVNSSDEIKNIIVVDFENVSQKENPQ